MLEAIQGAEQGRIVMRSVPLNLALSLGLSACASHAVGPRPAAAPTPAPPPLAAARAAVASSPAPVAAASDVFRDSVRPVLQRRCTPCHEPGGVMYGRMPFDQPETIRGHREGVLRRLKAEDHATVAAWLESN